MRRTLMLLVAAVCVLPAGLGAQSESGDKDNLRAVVVLARHGARSPIGSEMRNGVFNAQPWPKWPVEPGLLTPHGIAALERMGEFYKQQYGSLLKGCSSVAVESTNVPRTIASAKAVMKVVAPECDVAVTADLTTDPPMLDRAKLADAVNGRIGGDPAWFMSTYARQLEAMHDVLAKCDGCNEVPDFRTMMLAAPPPTRGKALRGPLRRPIVIPRDPHEENAVALGADFAENLLLEYVEGMSMKEVGWGRVDRAKLDDLVEMNTRYHDFMLRTPLWSHAAAAPLAEKIARLLETAAKDGTPARLAYLSAHDANLGWLGGLLKLDWKVSDEAQNATPPGSAMVFELWHDAKTNAGWVRVKFVAQTLDQIRELKPLTGSEGPSISPVYVPGCSGAGPEYACSVEDFVQVVRRAAR